GPTRVVTRRAARSLIPAFAGALMEGAACAAPPLDTWAAYTRCAGRPRRRPPRRKERAEPSPIGAAGGAAPQNRRVSAFGGGPATMHAHERPTAMGRDRDRGGPRRHAGGGDAGAARAARARA